MKSALNRIYCLLPIGLMLMFSGDLMASESLTHKLSTGKSVEKNCKNLKLQVLGAGGPEINDGLASASFLLWVNNKARIMIDAGGGSSLNFEKSAANLNDLDAILFTHFHVDHSAALPVYIKAGYFSGRSRNLMVFGPPEGEDYPSAENFIAALFSDNRRSVYAYLSDNYRQQDSTEFLIKAQSVHSNGKIWQYTLSDNISIAAINVIHGSVPALAWRINYQGCSISFSGDMNGSSGHLQKLADKTDLLVANNAIPQAAGRIAKKLHMTPKIIGKIAAEAQVKKLVLSHFMLRTRDRKSESIAFIKQAYQGEVILSDDLMVISF